MPAYHLRVCGQTLKSPRAEVHRTGGGPRARPRPVDPTVHAMCVGFARKRRLEEIMTAALDGDDGHGVRREKIPRDEGVTSS